ncbi:uncharacterized protein LOC121712067 isoform X2 [Alosa sapidissima]|uniref:uncharacterized protein LOC121689919 isoform X2 n=1 Tax=Alosa sapidissima TaxID=34773 RepID=UPI001C09A226|nr:uncharacterized protein LOC121689919 isoform X2 [Alosa sapidissima]XP_041926098.1 uncharacterized protein LOC121689922 isoform X2 [Alosa sapidissima]XP_041930160.1 uncharacterized protein LOC121694209 isoform X2 [Alosa sapidissima]XP_041951975.1 uncharacterized protein LOC121712067 isoform X2 [Alosa sapidissima]
MGKNQTTQTRKFLNKQISFCFDQRLKVSQTDPAKEFLKMYGGIPQTSSDEINNLKKSVSALTQKNIDLEKECQKWKDLVLQDVPGLIFGMKKIICQPASPRTPGSEDCPSQCLPYFTQPTSSPSSTVSTQSSSPSASSQSSKMAIDAGSGDMDTTSSSPSKVEIFKGSGVMVDKLAWAYAVNANSCTTFVRQLLTAVFPPEVLLVSNLRGTNKGKGEARLPLEKTKVDAIYNATLERWPGTPLSLIGSSINGKITEMRNKVKQQK